ncbi:MAG: imidazole glycerol phosphate synthase subunit HisH [Synergistaceae bacterium]|jgi:glutamine amidotransferase|nr:imidazole glycerol phosphate synthase subunit HisH [Synergistaceae bacterium]
MIGIIDYGMGNLRSVSNAFRSLGYDALIASSPDELDGADKVVLPGVGAFARAIDELRKSGWADRIYDVIASGRPLIGICLGMQLLFETSYENGAHRGLGVFPGLVRRIPDGAGPDGRKLKIPQVGWNRIDIRTKSDILDTSGDTYVYFVHSYYADTDPEYVSSTASYGTDITASVERGSVYGVQFHPEKSGSQGLEILRKFAALGGRAS